eukprot:COSAG06_NODE_10828_length_1610_cov_2.035076_2_plen_220_part_00
MQEQRRRGKHLLRYCDSLQPGMWRSTAALPCGASCNSDQESALLGREQSAAPRPSRIVLFAAVATRPADTKSAWHGRTSVAGRTSGRCSAAPPPPPPSRGQRSRAAGAYRSGLHEDEPRRGAVVLGRLCSLRLARARSGQSSVREAMEQRRRARAKATACGMAVCRRRHVLRRDRQTDGHRVPSQVASGRRGRFRAGSGRVLRVRTGAVSMMVSRGVVL